MNELELRNIVKESGIRLIKEGLVRGTWGNVSVRLDENSMIVTPSGLDYLSLKPEDMVVVDINTLEYEGENKPTTERKIHAAIYKERPEINAIIHTHSPWCSSLAAARVELPAIGDDMVQIIGGDVKVGPYGLPSTSKLTNATVAAIRDRKACLMAGHGVLVCGVSLDEAFNVCQIIEAAAKEYVSKHVSAITGKVEVGIEQIKEAFDSIVK
jgi:L-fuculose-phosphate aldolase